MKKIVTLILFVSHFATARDEDALRKVAVLELQPNGVEEVTASTLSQILLEELAAGGGLSVLGRSDLGKLISVDEMKLLLGCPQEDATCAVERGRALGDAILVWGTIGRVEDRVVISAAAIDMRAERAMGRASRSVSAKDGEDMIQATREIAAELRAALGLSSPATWKPILAALVWGGGSLAGSMGSGGELNTWQTAAEAELDIYLIEELALLLKVGVSFGSGHDEANQRFTAYLVPVVLGAKWRWIRDWVTPYLGAGVGFGFLDLNNQGALLAFHTLAGVEIAPPRWKRFAFCIESGFFYQRSLASRDLARLGGRIQAGIIYRF